MSGAGLPIPHVQGPPRIEDRLQKVKRNIDILGQWASDQAKESRLKSTIENKKSAVAYFVDNFPEFAEKVIESEETYHVMPLAVSFDNHHCVMGEAVNERRSCFVTDVNVWAGSNFLFRIAVQPSKPSSDDLNLINDTRDFLVRRTPHAQHFNSSAAVGASSRMFGIDGDWVVWEGSADVSPGFFAHKYSGLTLARQIPIEACLDREMLLFTYRQHERDEVKRILDSLAQSGYHIEASRKLRVNRTVLLENVRYILGDYARIYKFLGNEKMREACEAFLEEHLSEKAISRQFKLPFWEVRRLLTPFDTNARVFATSFIFRNAYTPNNLDLEANGDPPYHLRAFPPELREKSAITRGEFLS